MSNRVDAALEPLSDHWDRLVRTPLSDEEIDDIESGVGVPMPPILREYLETVGLFQDFCLGGVPSIITFTKQGEFSEEYKFLLELLGEKEKHLFPFGGDGAGNVYALSNATPEDDRIVFADHEFGTATAETPFFKWLKTVADDVSSGISDYLPNSQKEWYVQFSFEAPSPEEIFDTMASIAEIANIDSPWVKEKTSPAGVKSKVKTVLFNAAPLRFERNEYRGWPGPHFHFNFSEPVETPPAQSLIRMLDTVFTSRFENYKLIDYGPLPEGIVDTPSPSSGERLKGVLVALSKRVVAFVRSCKEKRFM